MKNNFVGIITIIVILFLFLSVILSSVSIVGVGERGVKVT